MTRTEKVREALCVALNMATLASRKEDKARLNEVLSLLDGCVIVPREATEGMLDAAWSHTKARTAEERMACELGDSRLAFSHKMARRYSAMIAASEELE